MTSKMKTLYIPTTTLNFNNIMSSESISPKTFYTRREFGYKNWHDISENPFDNSILLYEEIPMIIRPKSDYDDYPMVIAVCLSEKELEDMPSTDVTGVRQYDKTIYLTPSNTTIFFDTEYHKRIALSKSESSAETKMVELYQHRMLCALMEKKYDISLCKDIALCDKEIEKDQRINKMKGLLYGYYIGAALSMSENDLRKLNILNEIKNIFAAILASLDGIATQKQQKRLRDLFTNLNLFDPVRIQLKRIIESTDISTEEKIENIITTFKNSTYEHCYSNSFQDLLYEVQKGKPKHGDNSAITWINKAIEDHITKVRLHKNLLTPEREEIELSSLSVTTINSKNVKIGKPEELLKTIINDVLTTNKYNGKISISKMDLATEITLKAKDVFADEWNDSCQAKIYLNALRKHIAGEPFVQTWNAGILGSIASVILKGDDWEKLLDFLQTKEIADYRLAFAIYGALNGFANITRDFSDIILKEKTEYVNDVYRFFHQQLHETDLCISDIPHYNKTNEYTIKQPYTSSTETQHNINDKKSLLNKTTDNIEEHIGDNSYDNDLPEYLSTIFNSEVFGKIKSEAQEWYKNETLKLWGKYKTNSIDFRKELSSLEYPIRGTKTQWKECIKLTTSSKKKISEKKANNERNTNAYNGSSLFTNVSSGSFLDDYDFLISNPDFNSIASKCSHNWKADLKWFIDAHNPKHEDYDKYYKNKQTDNRTVINQFLFLKEKKYKKLEQILMSIYFA